MSLLRSLVAPLCAALLLSLAGCPPEEQPDPVHVEVEAACDNVNPLYCMLPWPSSRYLAEDSSTETGWRVDYPDEAFVPNLHDEPFDAAPYNRLDGFSPASQILTLFDQPVSDANLPHYTDIDASLEPDCPTVILDMETGERVAHFAEFDVRFDDPAEIMMYLRPARRLEEDRRYAVAIRDLKYDAGADVEPSAVFAALRDGVLTDSAQVEARRPGFEEVFDALEAAGVDRLELIQAWDFHTASGPMLWGDLLHMRDDALQRVGEDGLGCTITSEELDDSEQIHKIVRGTITVPSYMDSPHPPARVVRGADGLPEYQEDVEVEFVVNIPTSLAEPGADPGRLVTYGHGLMGHRDEVTWSGARPIADELGVVLVSTNWAGMSEDDLVTVATALSNVTTFANVSERVMQGIINMVVLTRTMQGVCTEQPELQVDGHLAYDPDERYYLGISQGSIYGATYMALTPDVERGVLNVGGIIYPVMIGRSMDFTDYDLIYTAWYEDRIDREFYMNLIQQLWDMCEGGNFVPHLLADPLPGTPEKKILYQIGLNDSQVPNIASDMAARTMGLPVIPSEIHEVWGVEEAPASPFDGSAIQYWDLGAPAVPEGNQCPLEDNDAHEGVRRTASAKAQMDDFWHPDGQVVDHCDGACDPD